MSEKDINNLKEMLVDFNEYSTDYTKTRCRELEETIENTLKEIERLNNKEERLMRRLEDLIIIGEQVENEWAVDICKMIIEELKGSDSNE